MKKNHTKNTSPGEKHILVMRFSAMGDVVLSLPVLRGVLRDNPDFHITLLTRDFFTPFFENIERLEIQPADFTGRHKGFFGIIRLFMDVRKRHDYDYIFDIHGVIRTYLLSFLFWVCGKPVFRIKKERRRKEHYLHTAAEPDLKHSIERYCDVMKEAKIFSRPVKPPVFSSTDPEKKEVGQFLSTLNIQNHTLIGIAPFAKHKLKVWPLNQVRNFIAKLSEKPGIHLLLFGGGDNEKKQLTLLADRYSHCTVVNLKLNLEIALISRLHGMVSMDSANMHIAALTGIPVISIWGATHPGMGFSAWEQPEINTVQISLADLPCRPCSIYGRGTCHRGDFACMERINAEVVIERLQHLQLI